MHVCVNNLRVNGNDGASESGPTKFNLRGEATTCPGKYLLDTRLTICSETPNSLGKLGAHSDGCDKSGVCNCRKPYAPPPEVVVFADSGFEDCSALVVDTEKTADVKPQSVQFHRDYEQLVRALYVHSLYFSSCFTLLVFGLPVILFEPRCLFVSSSCLLCGVMACITLFTVACSSLVYRMTRHVTFSFTVQRAVGCP